MSGLQGQLFAEAGPPVGAARNPAFRGLEALPSTLRLGTSSWAFPGWRGLLYARVGDRGQLGRAGLAAYAAHGWLRTVSIDRAYYGAVAEADYRAYAGQVPESFRFVSKTPRALTEPRSEGARNPAFLDPALVQERVVNPFLAGCGARAGLLLFQFTPSASRLFCRHRSLFLARLTRLLEGVDFGPVVPAVEVRAPRLFDRALLDLLRGHGAVPCLTIHPAAATLERQAELARDYAFPVLALRWNLAPGRDYEAAKRAWAPFDALQEPDPRHRALVAELLAGAWAGRREAYVIANNKAEGSAPLTLAALARAVLERVA